MDLAWDYMRFARSRAGILQSFVTPFVKATRTTLEIQANLKIKAGRPYVNSGDRPPGIRIAGVLCCARLDALKKQITADAVAARGAVRVRVP